MSTKVIFMEFSSLVCVLRILFIFFGAEVYYSGNIFTTGDTFSYEKAFITLWSSIFIRLI